jgi:hypothetical protein
MGGGGGWLGRYFPIAFGRENGKGGKKEKIGGKITGKGEFAVES